MKKKNKNQYQFVVCEMRSGENRWSSRHVCFTYLFIECMFCALLEIDELWCLDFNSFIRKNPKIQASFCRYYLINCLVAAVSNLCMRLITARAEGKYFTDSMIDH